MAIHKDKDHYSIGDVAEATALSVDTIRVWERRYGRPVPVRLPSGHRRYSSEDVRWLRRVAEAIAQGHRPARVIPLSGDALTDLIASHAGFEDADESVVRLVEFARQLDNERLRYALRSEASLLGPMEFVNRLAAPFLEAVGREWADGRLDVRHEHLATQVIEDVLRGLRLNIPERDGGPVVMFTTLSGETHGAGLQMAALAAVVAGCRVALLGVDTPNPEIVRAAREIDARAVGVSVSLATGGVHTDRLLADLRDRLPSRITLIVGGQGARGVRRGPRGIRYFTSLEGFSDWVAEVS